MLIQTNSGQFCWISREIVFSPLLMKLRKIIRNHEKNMFLSGNWEKIPFFSRIREKPSKIVGKACFHADLDKIRLILLEIGNKCLFAFFY